MFTSIIEPLTGVINALVSYFWRRFITRPELTIEIIKEKSLISLKGISSKSLLNAQNCYDDQAILIFELTWKFNIRITNNSNLIAFYPELAFNNNGPKFYSIDKLNKFQPIKQAETIILKAEYRKSVEMTVAERTSLKPDMPEEFNDLGLLLAYQNEYKRKFYTLFDFKKNKNIFLRKSPIKYNN